MGVTYCSLKVKKGVLCKLEVGNIEKCVKQHHRHWWRRWEATPAVRVWYLESMEMSVLTLVTNIIKHIKIKMRTGPHTKPCMKDGQKLRMGVPKVTDGYWYYIIKFNSCSNCSRRGNSYYIPIQIQVMFIVIFFFYQFVFGCTSDHT